MIVPHWKEMIRIFYEFYHPVANDYYVFQKDEDFSFSSHLHYCFELIVVTDGRDGRPG